MYCNQNSVTRGTDHIPWNKNRLIGPKPPFKLREIWGIRIRLQLATRVRDLALFNLAIDSNLRGCDLIKLKCGMLRTRARRCAGLPSCSRRRPSR